MHAVADGLLRDVAASTLQARHICPLDNAATLTQACQALYRTNGYRRDGEVGANREVRRYEIRGVVARQSVVLEQSACGGFKNLNCN